MVTLVSLSAVFVLALLLLASLNRRTALGPLGIAASDLWRFDGEIDRGPYAILGFGLFAVKHNLDRLVAWLAFNKPLTLFEYFLRPEAVKFDLGRFAFGKDLPMYAALLAVALPFIWTGTALTARRLRSLGWPLYLVAFFFLPYLNLLFFLILCVVPAKSAAAPDHRAGLPSFLDRLIPRSAAGSAAAGIVLATAFVLAFTLLSANLMRLYGWGLFVGLPFCLGLGSALLYGYHAPRSFFGCLGVATLSVTLAGFALLAAAIEGAICLAMAFPFALVLAWMGATVGYFIQRRDMAPGTPSLVLGLLLLVLPGLMGMEYASRPESDVVAVRTTIDIEAPPEAVWKNVVSFAELPPPEHWIFKLGFAYPMRARITGRGPGAIRRCEFSTGAFVEPIEVWDEPKLLKFSVLSQPLPMRESSPWGSIHPPHLDSFLVSQGGQFLLTPLPGGGTRLEGTTWYRHSIEPSAYWRPWTDFILHRIHERVLAHVKRVTEAERS
ncbi:MAG: hypothetical protein HY077_09855 [Elusimicrobia bacterium]|nr:hypothetical protein [Elusimicrobiota bacterium]